MEDLRAAFLDTLRLQNSRFSPLISFTRDYEDVLRRFRDQPANPVAPDSQSSPTGVSQARVQSLATNVDKLQSALTDALKTNTTQASELATRTSELTHIRVRTAAMEDLLDRERQRRSDLESSLSTVQLQSTEKDEVIVVLKREHAELARRLEDAQNELQKVKAENAQYVEMILQQKQKQIDVMTEINELFATCQKQKAELEELRAKYRQQVESGNAGPDAASSLGADGDGDPAATLIHLAAPSRRESRMNVGSEVNSVHFSPNGLYFAAACADNTVKLYNTGSRQVVNVLHGCSGTVLRARFSKDDDFILGASADNSVHLWMVGNQRLRHTLTGHTKKVCAADFAAADVRRVGTGGGDRTLKVWDLARGTILKTILQTCKSTVNDLEISASSMMCSAHFDGSIRFHDIRTCRLTQELQRIHPLPVTSVSFSRDERYILTCGKDSILQIYDVRNYRMIKQFRHASFRCGLATTKACWSPCGRYVAVGSQNGRVVVWNVDSTRRETALRGHRSVVSSVCWLDTGERVLSGGHDSFVYYWS